MCFRLYRLRVALRQCVKRRDGPKCLAEWATHQEEALVLCCAPTMRGSSIHMNSSSLGPHSLWVVIFENSSMCVYYFHTFMHSRTNKLSNNPSIQITCYFLDAAIKIAQFFYKGFHVIPDIKNAHFSIHFFLGNPATVWWWWWSGGAGRGSWWGHNRRRARWGGGRGGKGERWRAWWNAVQISSSAWETIKAS